jgi:acetyl-CoA C-acetyltransferase
MVYLHQALRTSLGKAGGIYKDVLPEALMAMVLKEMHERSGLYAEEILLGNAFGTGGNMARYAALLAAYPDDIPATTVDTQCSSGLKSLELGYAVIKAGLRNSVICGGLESISLAPEKRYAGRDPRGPGQPYTVAQFSPFQDGSLQEAAERCAVGMGKESMWEWAQLSQQRAAAALPILSPYIVKDGHSDPPFRPDLQPQKYSSEKNIDRTVTAHFRDGAAGVFLSARKEGALARIHTCLSIGNDPNWAPEGAILATRAVLREAQLQVEDIDLFEVSESYALIPLRFERQLNVPREKINILGGTLAYGHPYGASGAVQMVHLCAAMQWRNARYGLCVIPGAGGIASAMILENVI